MQGRAELPKRKLIVLVVASVAAIASMIIAPDGAVGELLARAQGNMTAAENLKTFAPKPLPPFAFLDKSTQGKVVVVNFWALWCATCKVEKPKLDKLQADYADKGLVVLTISDSGDDLEVVRNYFADHHFTHLKPARDEDGVAFRDLHLKGLPTTLILNKKGEEIARTEGMVDWDDKAVRQFLDKMLAEPGH